MANLSNINNKFIVESDGDVGIGVTTALDKLNVGDGNIRISQVGDVASQLILNTYQSALGNTTYKWFVEQTTSANSYSFQIGNGTTPYLHINSLLFGGAAGNVGIGTDSPGYKLDVVGSIKASVQGRFASGSASTPAYSFDSDSDSGIYRATTNALGFATAGAERMRIDSVGNVGIGKAPQSDARLHTYRNSTDAYNIFESSTNRWVFGEAGGVCQVGGRYGHHSGIQINTVGNVGIGVTPESWGTGGDTEAIQISTMTSLSEAFDGTQLASNFYFDGTNDKYIQSDFATSYLQIDGSHRWRYAASGTADANITWSEAMRINSSGNVGIGIDSPSQKLQVDGGAFGFNQGIPATSGTTQNGMLRLTPGSSVFGETFDFGMNVAPTYAWMQATNKGSLAVNYNLALNPNGGNVWIGTTSPSKLLTLDDASGAALQWQYNGGNYLRIEADSGGGSYYAAAGLYHRFFTSGSERMRITSGGALLVNRQSSLLGVHTIQADISGGGTSVLTVYNQNLSDNSPAINAAKNSATTSSTARFIQFYADGGTVPMGGIVGNGASNVQFAALSDIREKENIKTIESSLDKIDKLNPVEFDWKKSGEHIDAGFIAQEVEEVFPEYVVENISNEGEEERKGLTGGMTSGIVAHLVKSIQELKADNDSLKARIETLENN